MWAKDFCNRRYHEYSGCVHNHTSYSFDTEVPLARVLDAARRTKLDYLTINDHMNNDAARDPLVKQVTKFLVVVGFEQHDINQNNHYLVFGSDQILHNSTPDIYVPFYKQKGAVGFIAHPCEKRMSRKFRTYDWTDHNFLPVDGVEIFNFASNWMGKLSPVFNGLALLWFPWLFVRKPHAKTIHFWESYQARGIRLAAIGSTDAHGLKVKRLGFTMSILTHEQLFRTVRTNVLLPTKQQLNQQSLLAALRLGKSYIVNYRVGNPRGFMCAITNNKETALLGEEITLQPGLSFKFKINCKARVELYHNGMLADTILASQGAFKITQKGRWRLVCRRFSYGWIYTNNIYVI